MGFVVAGFSFLTQRHDKFLAVVRELEDLMPAVVHQPDVFLGVVRADDDSMWTGEQTVVLLPRLDQFAGGVIDAEDVFPPRVRGGGRSATRRYIARGKRLF